jgi:hypothetical protein
MAQAKYDQAIKSVVDSIMLEIPGVVSGKMFGYPAYYINGKLIACIYQDGVGMKVPEVKAQELLNDGNIVHFQPMGRRKMREWIQINHPDANTYLEDQSLFEEAVTYVRSLTKKGPS